MGTPGQMGGSAAPDEFILSDVTNRLPDPPPCGRALPDCTVAAPSKDESQP